MGVVIRVFSSYKGSEHCNKERVTTMITFLSRIFGGIGILMLAVGAFLVVQEQTFLGHAVPTSATVFSLVPGRNSSGEPVQCPVVAFTAANGQTIDYEASDFCANPPRYQVGQPIQVLYDPQNPSEVQFSGFVGEFGLAALLTLLGLPLFLLGVWMFFWVRRLGRQAVGPAN
jgi:hypothetical protein